MAFKYASPICRLIKAPAPHTQWTAFAGVAIVVCFLFLRLSAPRGEQAPAILECFDVAKDGDALLVPVTLEGRRADFILDTGCSLCVIDTSLRTIAGRRTRSTKMFTVSGIESVDLFESPSIHLGRAKCDSSSDVVCTTFRRRIQGRQVLGALGASALASSIIRIDCDNGRVCFLDSVPRDAGERCQLVWEHPRTKQLGPDVVIEIAGHGAERFSIDTGCIGPEAGMMKHDLFDALYRSGDLELVGYAEPSLNLTKRNAEISPGGSVRGMSLNGIERSGVVFRRTAMNALGLGFLSRYIVVFDFKDNAMYLKEGSRYYMPDRYDLSGMTFNRMSYGFVVKRILSEQCPAAKVNIAEGDVITAIDGMPSSMLSLFEFRGKLCNPGEHALVVQRGTHEVTLMLPLSLPTRKWGSWTDKRAGK